MPPTGTKQLPSNETSTIARSADSERYERVRKEISRLARQGRHESEENSAKSGYLLICTCTVLLYRMYFSAKAKRTNPRCDVGRNVTIIVAWQVLHVDDK